MAGGEDCATVLEGFVQDAANLPLEINYMMEEIQAKDKDMQRLLTQITSRDSSLQKHVKANTGMQPHPKENEWTDNIKKNYDQCIELQDAKIQLSERACALYERQMKRLDIKIRELQSDGQLIDGPPLPSVFNRKPEKPVPGVETSEMPLQAASVSALNAQAHRLNSQIAPLVRQPPSRQLPHIVTTPTPQQRASLPTTPATALQQQREVSAGADKRRKAMAPVGSLNVPAQPSSLRQSSTGPGTPKAGTPTGGSRAGSMPRTSIGAPGLTKKSGISKRGPAHQQVSKLKNRPNKHMKLSGATYKKGSPSVRGTRGGTAASEEDSVSLSGDASETDASQSRVRRGKKQQTGDVEVADDEEAEDEDAEDDRRYCTCNQRSYGEMVACENDDCPYEWFHMGCLNLKKVPDEDEDWYCPTCRLKPDIIEKMKAKQKKGLKK